MCGVALPVTPYLVITETGLRLPVFAGDRDSLSSAADALTGEQRAACAITRAIDQHVVIGRAAR